MKKVPSSRSSDSTRAVKESVVPFKQKTEEDADASLEIDANKLGALWAQSTDALNIVGDGFENVIEAINALIDDNVKGREDNAVTRQDNRRTRHVVFAGVAFMMLFGVGTMYMMKTTIDRATLQVRDSVNSQLQVLDEVKVEASKLREETKVLSRMQASSIQAQVASSAVDLNDADYGAKLEAEKKVLEAEVEAARGMIHLAETKEEKADAEEGARVVAKKARSKQALLGPVGLEELSDL